jgi:thiosulfate/3-mercaptopyruvate sulfurtransferase
MYPRYLGTDPEPRPGLSSGHVPNSFSLPFNAFLKTQTSPQLGTQYTTFLPPAEIYKALVDSVGAEEAEMIIKGHRPVITSCGSGMTAGVLWLGLKLLGAKDVAIYDEVSSCGFPCTCID